MLFRSLRKIGLGRSIRDSHECRAAFSRPTQRARHRGVSRSLGPPVGDRDYTRGTRLPDGGAGRRPGCRRQVASACELLRPGRILARTAGSPNFLSNRVRRRGATLFWVGPRPPRLDRPVGQIHTREKFVTPAGPKRSPMCARRAQFASSRCLCCRSSLRRRCAARVAVAHQRSIRLASVFIPV